MTEYPAKIALTIVMLTLVFVSEDIFVFLVKLNRRIRLKRMIRKFREDRPKILGRDKPVHVSTLEKK